MNTVAVRPVDPKVVKSLFNRHLDLIARNWNFHHFDEIRHRYMLKGEPHDGSPDTREADYKAEVEAKATEIRKEAFDRMIADVSHQMHTQDVDIIWAATRKAGFKVKLGDIFIAEGPLALLPVVFHEDAFKLYL